LPALVLSFNARKRDAANSDVDPENRPQIHMPQQPTCMDLETLIVRFECRQPISDIFGCQAHRLSRQRAFLAPNCHFPQHLILASQTVSEGHFVQLQFQPGAPIMEQFQEVFLNPVSTIERMIPAIGHYFKTTSTCWTERGVD